MTPLPNSVECDQESYFEDSDYLEVEADEEGYFPEQKSEVPSEVIGEINFRVLRKQDKERKVQFA